MSKPKLLRNLFVLTTEDEHKLMEQVQAGNQKAFKKLFDKYKDQIFSFTLCYVKREDIAYELTQETFMRVYKHAQSYRAEHKFKTWIYTIARNLALDYLKKKKEVTLGASDDEYDGIEDYADQTINIEQQLLEKAQKEVVQKCLDNLKPSQKEALTLRIFSENSYAEIASLLGKTEQSIKALINRAKENLVKCVKNCMEEV